MLPVNLHDLGSVNDTQYFGGVFVLTSAAAKGLEFDVVIVNDASEKTYSSEKEEDMHLLHVLGHYMNK